MKQVLYIIPTHKRSLNSSYIKMSTSHQHSDDMSGLYEASSIGCVDTLNQLLHQNPQILHKISLTSFTETPLHISSLLGHLDFTKALLSHKPQLALELDSSRSTPLHLASAEGHIQIVKELVGVNEEACLVGDEEGRIPLHYAAMRGRMEVVRELVRAKPESLSLRDNINGNTTLHFCVIYNHLETLKAIVELLEPERSGELLNYTNSDGKNTILHLAVMFKQVETVKYLLTIPQIRSEARSMKNERGYTVHEMLERSPKDMKSLRIQLMFINYNIIDQSQTPEPTRDVADDDEEVERPRENNESNCCVIRIYKSIVNWFRPKDMDKWFKEMKSNLCVVAILISTLSFQALINPPGGFIQQGLASSCWSNSTPHKIYISSSLSIPIGPPQPQNAQNCLLSCSTQPNGERYCPGEAILASSYPDYFYLYVICNSCSFILSLCVVLLRVSGFSLENRAVMWTLSYAMWFALTFLASAYGLAAAMIVPNEIYWDATTPLLLGIVCVYGLLGIIQVVLIIRISIWIVKIIVRAIKRMVKRARNQNARMLLL